MPQKHIIFDVVGTLVSYQHFFTTLSTHLSPLLLAHSLSGPLLAHAWLESSEREYTYLSLSGSYTPFSTVFAALFYRVLYMAGVPNPRSVVSDEDVAFLIAEYKKCTVRPGVKEAVEKLKSEGWEVWAFTSGDRERVCGYFAAGGVGIEQGNVVTCDELGVGKPDLRAYERVRGRIGVAGREEAWYAAAHAWDVSAAGRAGLKTAYCTVLEGELLEEVFGEMDVVKDDFGGLVDGILAAAEKKRLVRRV